MELPTEIPVRLIVQKLILWQVNAKKNAPVILMSMHQFVVQMEKLIEINVTQIVLI